MRSAFIMRTPGMPHVGKATDSIIGSVDIYPTLVELAGLPKPEHLDGKSFAETLHDPQADSVGFAMGIQGNSHTLRTDRHRVILEGANPRLFDHARDPGETRNIAGDEPDTVESLRERLDVLLESRKAR